MGLGCYVAEVCGLRVVADIVLTCSSVARLVVHLVFRFVGCFMMLTGVYWWWFLFAGCCLICCGCCGWLLTAWLSVLTGVLVWFGVCWYRLVVV